MEKAEAAKIIVETLNSIQLISGRTIGEITGSTCPIGDLDGFDSLCGVEASFMLSSQLGFELPGVNAFVNEQGTKALSVDQIADTLCNLTVEAGT